MAGQIIETKITDINENAVFTQREGITYQVALDQLEETPQIGENLKGLAYEDRKGTKRLQVQLPKIRPGIYDWAPVVSLHTEAGAFVDIGLDQKDILLSSDDLPLESWEWPKVGDELFVTYEIDERQRFWAKLGYQEEISRIRKKAPARLQNQDTKARVYRLIGAGAQVFTQDGYDAFIHTDEQLNPLRLGEEVEARVIDVHLDGRLNLSTRPRAHELISEDAQMILAVLSRSLGGFLPLHDKSQPDEIKNFLGISKKQFKRAVGNLLKEGRIRQEVGEGIYLLDKGADK
ncbi:CvfB family protein [Hutsoniella sourekii]